MKCLVVGATGHYAGLVVPELVRRGATVRALIRDAGKEALARARGAAEVAVGDLRDAASLRAAAEGVDGVFHLNPAFAPDEGELGVRMVEAAVAAGVKKLVFSGAIHPSIDRMSNHRGKRAVEEALYESGLAFVVLQPNMFLQTLAGSWPSVLETGRFGLPYSVEKRASYVDFRDVAEAAAIGLTTDRLDLGTFELSSPGMFSRVDVAAAMSAALGREIEAAEPGFDAWAEAAGIPDAARDGLRTMYGVYDRFGFPGGNDLVLRAILGREPRTLAGYVEELAREGPRAGLAPADH